MRVQMPPFARYLYPCSVVSWRELVEAQRGAYGSRQTQFLEKKIKCQFLSGVHPNRKKKSWRKILFPKKCSECRTSLSIYIVCVFHLIYGQFQGKQCLGKFWLENWDKKDPPSLVPWLGQNPNFFRKSCLIAPIRSHRRRNKDFIICFSSDFKHTKHTFSNGNVD